METSLPSGQGHFLTGTRKELCWAQARHKGEALALKCLQNPIGKAWLHRGEGNILIFRGAAAPRAAQSTGKGHSTHISLCLSHRALDLQPGLTQGTFLETFLNSA